MQVTVSQMKERMMTTMITMTNNELFRTYSAYQYEHMSYKTYYARTNLLKNHFLPRFGALDVTAVSRQDISNVYDALKAWGLADNTVFGVYAALFSFFSMAVEMNLIEENPASRA